MLQIYLCSVKRYKTQMMNNVLSTPKKVILMVAMAVTVIGYANSETRNTIKDAKRTAITLNVKQGNSLYIKDANGTILYKEVIEQEGVYSKGFDLSALPNGNYVVELEKDVEIKLIPFEVLEAQVIFNKEEESTFFKPITRVKDNLIYVSKLALDNENLNVEVYKKSESYASESYELVFEETMVDTKNLERIYKLSNEGDYKIVYFTKGRTFTEYINN